MEKLVEVKNLKKNYGSKEAVKDISFSFMLNEIPFTASFEPYFFLRFFTSTKLSIKI